MNALARAALNFAQLRRRFVDDGGDLRDLFLCQAEFKTEMATHPFTQHCGLWLEKEMPGVRRADERAGSAASKEDERKAGD